MLDMPLSPFPRVLERRSLAGAWRAPLLGASLFLFDGALLDGLLWLGRHAWVGSDPEDIFAPLLLRAWLVPLALLALGAYPGYGLHPARRLRKRACAVFLAFMATLVDVGVWHPHAWSALPALAGTFGLALLFWPLGNRLAEGLAQALGWWGTPVVILGAGLEGQLLARTLRREPSLGFLPVAFYDDNPFLHGRILEDVPVRGPLAAARNGRSLAGTAIVAMPSLSREASSALVGRLPFPRVLIVPDLDGIQSMWLQGADLGGRLALTVTRKNLYLGNRLLKRAWDLTLGLPIALLCAPVVLALAAVVRGTSPGSPFYFQMRAGWHGRPIRVWKLRTMYVDAQARLDRHLASDPEAKAEWERRFKLQEDPRILPGIGRFLRRTSLDELPQIWNVLKGEMSLVGPRPFPFYHLEAFGEGFRELRSSVLPGMTGLWQVSAREGGDLEDQERLDAFYIHNWSLWQDVDLLLRTVGVVLRCTGT
jgi:Undecaprenyl-phosphate galactose phosphotransferase WbaP